MKAYLENDEIIENLYQSFINDDDTFNGVYQYIIQDYPDTINIFNNSNFSDLLLDEDKDEDKLEDFDYNIKFTENRKKFLCRKQFYDYMT